MPTLTSINHALFIQHAILNAGLWLITSCFYIVLLLSKCSECFLHSCLCFKFDNHTFPTFSPCLRLSPPPHLLLATTCQYFHPTWANVSWRSRRSPTAYVPPSMWTAEKPLAQPRGSLPPPQTELKPNTALDGFQIRHMTNRAIWRAQQKFSPVLTLSLYFFFVCLASERTGMKRDRASEFCFLSHLEDEKSLTVTVTVCHDEAWVFIQL